VSIRVQIGVHSWFVFFAFFAIFCGYSGFTMSSSSAGSNQLKTWDDKISSLTQRILALYEPPEFNVLRQFSDQSAGDAASQSSADHGLRDAVSTVCDALVLNLRLTEKISEAKALRAKTHRLFQANPEPEIETILTRPMVAVDPTELQNARLFPLEARKYAVAELYNLLEARVNEATAVLTEATRKLRDSRQLLSAVELEMKQARQSLSRAGLDYAQLDPLPDRLHTTSVKLAQEPLSEALRIEIKNGITEFKTQVQERIAAVNRLTELRTGAVHLSEDLRQKHRRAQQIFVDRLARVQVHSGGYPPVPEDDIKDLLNRLRPLLIPNEDIPGTIALFEGWLACAKGTMNKTELSLQKNQAYLDHRLELRGLLSALNAKAAALNQAEDRQISGLLNQAHTLLYQRPSPVELAREMLSQVERRLNQVDPTD
jgi:hypothetical protein